MRRLSWIIWVIPMESQRVPIKYNQEWQLGKEMEGWKQSSASQREMWRWFTASFEDGGRGHWTWKTGTEQLWINLRWLMLDHGFPESTLFEFLETVVSSNILQIPALTGTWFWQPVWFLTSGDSWWPHGSCVIKMPRSYFQPLDNCNTIQIKS